MCTFFHNALSATLQFSHLATLNLPILSLPSDSKSDLLSAVSGGRFSESGGSLWPSSTSSHPDLLPFIFITSSPTTSLHQEGRMRGSFTDRFTIRLKTERTSHCGLIDWLRLIFRLLRCSKTNKNKNIMLLYIKISLSWLFYHSKDTTWVHLDERQRKWTT